eukprot:CAMPEP_0119044726 /NCGR_PEP_ID=MMETSP1177-20130426/33973_1 /TAXON_ID=2985 /ORGANISM="Ochromonas sp, Strain CCMP1899" /LENGTH=632 /DNA_ID=CAMNT_0007015301 /DNA_START=493 /DNA_END=2391 /DNA_ORIENTATION=+
MNGLAVRTRNDQSVGFGYSTPWDTHKIHGCVCDGSRSGYDCSDIVCPTGDDPLTPGQVNEIQVFKCGAVAGSFAMYYQGLPSAYINFNANQAAVTEALLTIPAITGIKVTFTQGENTPICAAIPQVIIVEFTENFGPQPPLLPFLDLQMESSGGSIVVSADGKTVLVNSGSVEGFLSVKGTKESEACANRGLCPLSTGICSCYNTNGDVYASSDGYGSAGQRGDCGFIRGGSKFVSSCPGEVQCSGHGLCGENTFRCNCDEGWESGDCSEISCPLGRSWFDYPTNDNIAHVTFETCSHMGKCDTSTGKCICRIGYFGEACQYMSCPDNGLGLGGCSGHGRCMDMKELALSATNNGDKAAYTYGEDPNNRLTWDGGRIFGCLCDTGFHGYDCSLSSCPRGDDPGTYNDNNEVQLLTCRATDGFFRLTFRQETTGPIYHNATVSVVAKELSQLPSTGPTSVFFIRNGALNNETLSSTHPPPLPSIQGEPVNGFFNVNNSFRFNYNITTKARLDTPVCRTDGTQTVIIQFDSTHGPLPPITSDNSQLFDTSFGLSGGGSGRIMVYSGGGTVNGLRSLPGTTENAVCSNRGLCDEDTGECDCFSAWSSSNGRGEPGILKDCGYRNDMLHSFRDTAP